MGWENWRTVWSLTSGHRDWPHWRSVERLHSMYVHQGSGRTGTPSDNIRVDLCSVFRVTRIINIKSLFQTGACSVVWLVSIISVVLCLFLITWDVLSDLLLDALQQPLVSYHLATCSQFRNIVTNISVSISIVPLFLTVLDVVGPEGVRTDSAGCPQEVQCPGGDSLQPWRWIRCSTRQGMLALLTTAVCVCIQYDRVTIMIEQQHNLLFWWTKSRFSFITLCLLVILAVDAVSLGFVLH